MLTVELDTDALVKELGDRADVVLQRAVDALGEFALDNIRKRSADKLGIETWQEFSKSITVSKEKHAVTLAITDPRMAGIETGFSGFDIKEGLLKSPKAKQGKSGTYIDVPFEHKTTKRGKGSLIEPTSMRKAVEKAMSVAKSTGKTVRMGKRAGMASKLQDMKVSPEKGAQTFRRVSSNSPPTSWQHPGLDGIRAFEETAQEVERIKDRVVHDIAKAST